MCQLELCINDHLLSAFWPVAVVCNGLICPKGERVDEGLYAYRKILNNAVKHWVRQVSVVGSPLSPLNSLVQGSDLFPGPGITSPLLSGSCIQLVNCWSPPRYECHYCTLKDISPCWLLLRSIGITSKQNYYWLLGPWQLLYHHLIL